MNENPENPALQWRGCLQPDQPGACHGTDASRAATV